MDASATPSKLSPELSKKFVRLVKLMRLFSAGLPFVFLLSFLTAFVGIVMMSFAIAGSGVGLIVIYSLPFGITTFVAGTFCKKHSLETLLESVSPEFRRTIESFVRRRDITFSTSSSPSASLFSSMEPSKTVSTFSTLSRPFIPGMGAVGVYSGMQFPKMYN